MKEGTELPGKNSIEFFACNLQGISYPDWVKLKTAVDRYFEMRRKETEKGLRLSSADDVSYLIHSQFG